MRILMGLVAVLTLAACTADGKSPAMGGFLKGLSGGLDSARNASPPPTAAPPLQTSGAQAAWTGQGDHVQTVTGAMAWRCVYDYGGQRFVLMFDSYCPSSVSVK